MKQYATCPVCGRSVELEYATERPAISPQTLALHDSSSELLPMSPERIHELTKDLPERSARPSQIVRAEIVRAKVASGHQFRTTCLASRKTLAEARAAAERGVA